MNAPAETAADSPVSSPQAITKDRHRLVDGLRGVALLGIVIVNVEFILQHPNAGWRGDTSTVDLVTQWFVTTFAVLKIYPLFALLFGYGLSVQLARVAQRGDTLGPRYARRMLGLVILGVLHAVLFFPGDILVIYAAVGTIAYFLRRLSSSSLIRIAIVVYATASVLWLMAGGALAIMDVPLDEPVSAESLAILTTGGFADVIGYHLLTWPATMLTLALVQGPAAFACVLVGIALGRTDILTNPGAYRGRARRVLLIAGSAGLIGGAVGATLSVNGGEFTALGLMVGFAVAPALCAAYVSALMLMWASLPQFVSRLLQASGRMSLSVYLLQSVVLSTLAFSYGAGLFGLLSPLAGVSLAVGVWIGLSLFAMLWLRFARFGPAEWMLRSLSCWRVQPMRDRNRDANSHTVRADIG
ncbi:DUF418 domain-containing protein [Salinibacterium sp. M195]|uniref:DUF418 domain-containing protein n=1 Tax=Salinibacterium sp. M195 TaxID=2583374 RepID=UPI001C63953C|nr:DUF418 domain-containing protein [Salinibacterium sp. M195]QYH35128.1 DUF418 domain-containing protein [Salinibacterium sp. M195]